MATGDTTDFVARMRQVLPPWFGDDNPVLTALLSGFAATQAWLYSMVAYVRTMMRAATATGGELDTVAADFFGLRIGRGDGEGDVAFRGRIRRELLRPQATRAALVRELTELTGQTPLVIEPARPADLGGYGQPSMGYGRAGRYGSLRLPYQVLVTAYRPALPNQPSINGYGGGLGGYGRGSVEYTSLSQSTGVRDTDIMAAIQGVMPVATVAWVRLTNIPPVTGSSSAVLGKTFILNQSALQ